MAFLGWHEVLEMSKLSLSLSRPCPTLQFQRYKFGSKDINVQVKQSLNRITMLTWTFFSLGRTGEQKRLGIRKKAHSKGLTI